MKNIKGTQSVQKLPVFPLPNHVLLPGEELKLHVFELRYRAMVQTVLAGNQRIAIAFLKPGWERHYHETPEIHPVTCIGKILKSERLDDGRFDLVLIGQERARIKKELQAVPYRIAEVEVLTEKILPKEKADANKRWLINWIQKRLPPGSPMQALFKEKWSQAPLSRIVDAVAISLKVDIQTKMYFLAELDVGRRIEKLRPLLKGAQLTSDVWKKKKKP
jgi:uncharacterized protein